MATEHLFEKVAVGLFCAQRESWAVFSAIRDTAVTFVRFHVTRHRVCLCNRPPVFLALCQTRYMLTMPGTLLAAYLTSSMQGFVKVIAVSKVIAWEYHPCVLDIYDQWLANDGDDSLLSLSLFFFVFFYHECGGHFSLMNWRHVTRMSHSALWSWSGLIGIQFFGRDWLICLSYRRGLPYQAIVVENFYRDRTRSQSKVAVWHRYYI